MNDYDYVPDYDFPELEPTKGAAKKPEYKPRVDLAQIAPQEKTGELAEIVLRGDLSKLTFAQRQEYVNTLCAIWKLDPLTKPFDWMDLDNKLVLYINKGGAEQLRKIHGISITKLEKQYEEDAVVVTAYGRDSTGREDVASGIVSLMTPEKFYYDKVTKQKVIKDLGGQPLSREARINATLKAESKAKRRLTLSMGGLGMPSEDDIEDMKVVQAAEMALIEETVAQTEQIIASAQESQNGTFKLGENFVTGLELHQFISDKIEAIKTFEDLEAYLKWKKENKTTLSQYCEKNKEVCLTYGEQLKEKEDLIKASKLS